MSTLHEILESDEKPKQKIALMGEALRRNRKLTAELIECFIGGSVGDQGNCMAAIEYASRDEPDAAADSLEFVIEHLNDKPPRVRWEAASAIANLARQFPGRVAKAIPQLLANMKAEGTVVRWSAASALAEIAKHNPATRKELIPKFEAMVKKEANSGVRNIYLKALKEIAGSNSR
jgi:HEAT repeat protein